MSSSNQTVPKGRAKKPVPTVKRPSDKPNQEHNPGFQAKKPEPLLHLMGVNRVKFLAFARQLSEVLHLTYGDEMSITKFGRILLELKGQKSLKDMVYLDQKTLDLYGSYLEAKNLMIEEQNRFRSSFSTPTLETQVSLSKTDLFGEETRSGPSDEEGSPDSFRGESGPASKTTPF
jgi:hypothetical protein